MAFFKFRTRGPQANEARNSTVAAAPAESVEAMRRRARHRLLGAAVLVLIGVIGFPLLFDTQPRPVSVDIPIEIPDRTKAKPLTLPANPAPASGGAVSSSSGGVGNSGAGNGSSGKSAPASGSEMITEAADGTEITPGKSTSTVAEAKSVPAAAPAPEPKPQPKAESRPEARAESRSESRPETKPEPKPRAEVKAEAKPEPKPQPAKPAAAADGDRARALLEGKPAAVTPAVAKPAAAPDDNGRFVVQVGAFADAEKAREVRQKLDRAGLKTYTNVAKTADGERTRVRVGPFGTRAEADKAAGRVKGLSLPAAVLSL